MKLWRIPSFDLVTAPFLDGLPASSIAFLPDGRHLLIGTFIGDVVVWDFQKGEVIEVVKDSNAAINFSEVIDNGLGTVGESLGAAWGDYDNDGFPDLFVTCGTIFSPARSALYRNDGNLNSWIKVRCVGTDSNRSAIGAKIRVKAKVFGRDFWQMRQIVGTEGWVTFNSLDAVIGLGNAQRIDTLRVEWPSGTVQEFHGLAVKQTLTVVERTGSSLVRAGNGDLELKVSGPRQQRYRLETSADLTNWSTMAGLTTSEADGTSTFGLIPAAVNQRQFFRAVAECSGAAFASCP